MRNFWHDDSDSPGLQFLNSLNFRDTGHNHEKSFCFPNFRASRTQEYPFQSTKPSNFNHNERDKVEDCVAFVLLLKACSKKKDILAGARVHADILKRGLLGNPFIASSLVSMYARCGGLAEAEEVLEALPVRDVVSWNSLIASYAQGGHGKEALKCFNRMEHEGLCPDAVTFACILKTCGKMREIERGEKIHSVIAAHGLMDENVVLSNALVDMYVKCNEHAKAREVLEGLPVRDVVSWSSLISGYVHGNNGLEALKCFGQMQSEGILPSTVTFACILGAYSSIGALHKGECIHSVIIKQHSLAENVELGGALVEMYVKCGALTKAKEVLEGLPARDVVSWSTLIAGYVHGDHAKEALNSLERMQCEGISPNAITLSCILKACGSIGALGKGEQIHSEIVRGGLLSGNAVLGNALVDMYAKCGALEKAQKVLEGLSVRHLTTWNALIAGYAQRNCGTQALEAFEQMQAQGFSPDAFTFSCILKACGSIGALDKGQKFHSDIARQALLKADTMLGNALLDMYAKCGALEKAKEVLEGLSIRTVVSWSILITGYTLGDQCQEAVSCFERMQCEGLAPDAVTLACILKACGSLASLNRGEQIYVEISKHGLLSRNVVLGAASVDMYAKCGVIEKAKEVLEDLYVRNVVSWNALITGYAKGEHGRDALNCFELLQHEGLCPDEITFLCLLSACSHSGLLKEGQKCFTLMHSKYDIVPNADHCTCMIYLFGRVGLLNDALAFLKKLLSSSCCQEWFALLVACKQFGDSKLGSWVFEHAVWLHTGGSEFYILVKIIYAAAVLTMEPSEIEIFGVEDQVSDGLGWTWEELLIHSIFRETDDAQRNHNVKLRQCAEEFFRVPFSECSDVLYKKFEIYVFIMIIYEIWLDKKPFSECNTLWLNTSIGEVAGLKVNANKQKTVMVEDGTFGQLKSTWVLLLVYSLFGGDKICARLCILEEPTSKVLLENFSSHDDI